MGNVINHALKFNKAFTRILIIDLNVYVLQAEERYLQFSCCITPHLVCNANPVIYSYAVTLQILTGSQVYIILTYEHFQSYTSKVPMIRLSKFSDMQQGNLLMILS